MALPLWGLLEKAQDDTETIAQAIAAAIVAHEEDPTAHLGDGESLSVHKHDTTLDHPAQSVVADKEPYGLYDENQTYLSTSNWSVEDGSATLNNGRWLDMSLFSQTTFNAVSNMPYLNNAAYPDADLLFGFRLRLNGAQNSDGQARLFWAVDNDPGNARQVAFVKDGTTYKWQIIEASSVVHTYTMQTGGVFQEYVAVYFDSVNESIQLFIDGAMVSEYETVNWHDYILQAFSIDASRSTNTSIEVGVRFWKARYNLFLI
jgi:hypothetical protein